MTTVLVTGVGAVTGYGVLRSLRHARPGLRLVGIDIHPDAVGGAWCDEFRTCPPSADDGYPSWLRDTVADANVDLVIPTLDADLDRALRGDLTDGLNGRIALNSFAALRASRDKGALDADLVVSSDPVRIPTSMSSDFAGLAADLGLPFLLKPLHGYGGRGQAWITTEEEFRPFSTRLGTELLAQRIVGSDDQEYTVGVFGDGTGGIAARIAMRRRLAPEGMTRSTTVVDPPAALDAALDRLTVAYRFDGPTNLQFRRDGDQWWLLEINARVSSSTSMRALFGYNEADMAVTRWLDGRMPRQPPVRRGTAMRYLDEIEVPGAVEVTPG